MLNGYEIVSEAWERAQDPRVICLEPSGPIPRPPYWVSSTQELYTVIGAALGGRGDTRQNPSAGGLYPVEVHSLGPQTLRLGLAWWRTAAKYSHRAWVSCLLDLGYAIGAVEASAFVHGIAIDSIETHPDLRCAATITFKQPIEQQWDGPMLSSPPEEPHPFPENATIVRECLGASEGSGSALEPLRIHPGLEINHLLERHSGTRAAAPSTPIPSQDLEALWGILPEGCVIQHCDPDFIGVVSTGHTPPVRPLCRGDARPTLAQWCGGQPMANTCSGAVIFSFPGVLSPGSQGPQDLGRALINAGRHGLHTQLCATMKGLSSRPLAGWVNADIGRAIGQDSAFITHAVVLGQGTHSHD